MFQRGGGAAPTAPDASYASPTTNPFGFGAHKNESGLLSDRDPASPRPVSIASSEMPRPSTDSGSIWGRMAHPNRIWSPEEHPWAPKTASRRPSIHGSPSALKTTLADADDEILDEFELMHASPSQVGVIGTKPSTAKSLSQRLNPAAPSFMGGIFRARPDKVREASKETKEARDKLKGSKPKPKEPTRERESRASMSTVSEAPTPSVEESPSEPRQSRDVYSLHTPSIAESRESLNLERSPSTTPSESAAAVAAAGGLLESREEASGFKKLLRKGSSSKFSLSSVRGLGSGKKGPSSATHSDRNVSADRTSLDEAAEEFGYTNPYTNTNQQAALGRSYDSVASSPSLGPMASGSGGGGGSGSGTGGKPAKDKGVNWGRFSMKRKPGKEKEKESLDLDRSQSLSQSQSQGLPPAATAAMSPNGSDDK